MLELIIFLTLSIESMSQSFLNIGIGSMLVSMLSHPQKRIQKAALISISRLCINGKYYTIKYLGIVLISLLSQRRLGNC